MYDLKQDLRRAAHGYGNPGVALEEVRRAAARRNGVRRVSAALVALAVVTASGAFLVRAFEDGRKVADRGLANVENGPIAYSTGGFRGGSVEGFRIGLIDPAVDEVTGLDGYLSEGAWSVDGSRLAFVRDPVGTPYGDMSIRSARSDGTGVRQLTDRLSVDQGDYGPRWSPDGRHLLFFRNHPDRAPSVMIMNSDGSDAHRVAGGNDQVFFTAIWSPDGSQILTVRDEEGSREGSPMWLAVMSADGTHERVLVRGALSQPQWSPDGSQVFFYSGAAIHAVSSGGHERTVMKGIDPQGLSVFEVSPDGNRILFTQPVGPDEGEQLWVADIDRGDARKVAEGLHSRDPSPTWSPNGSAIAFVHGGDIWAIDLRTGDQSQITDPPVLETLPVWGAA